MQYLNVEECLEKLEAIPGVEVVKGPREVGYQRLTMRAVSLNDEWLTGLLTPELFMAWANGFLAGHSGRKV